MLDIVGVLSLLDPPLADVVQELWTRFERDFGSTGVQVFPHPNLTLQAGLSRDSSALEGALIPWVRELAQFEVAVEGIDYFEGPSPTVFLRVRPTDTLRGMNRQLAEIFSQHCARLIDQYQPARWIPHITIAMEDLKPSELARAREVFSGYQLECRQSVANMTLACRSAAEGTIRIVRSWRLGASDLPGQEPAS